MIARLKALAGPFKGSIFPLSERDYTIGRDKTNALCLEADAGVSRRHCVIEERHQQFTIHDSGSHNRTSVNDVEVQERRLEHGDQIEIGHSVFVFLVDGQPDPGRKTVNLNEDERPSGTTLSLPRADALYSRPERLLEAVPWPDRGDRIVSSILIACRAVLSVHVLHDLQQRLVESILDAIAAERAALLLVGDTPDEFATGFHWVRDEGERRSFRIPRAVIQGVLNDRAALCLNDVLTDRNFKPSDTIQQAHITAIMAAPIVAADVVVGVIYLDASNRAVRFGQDDLQLLTGIAGVFAGPLANALRTERLERENERLFVELAGTQPLIGSGERMRAVHRFVMKVAASDSTVLVSGASGTGKELVARALHRNSARSGKPFVAINCAAITETLLESEFFGHEKGAFTGAFGQKKGKLEEADGGTVFLDEIGELAQPLQAKLLRVLQEREFERVGGLRPIKVDIRVIAATNRDLEQEVRRGAFRQDLYFRLNVVSLKMPELRERREDIPLLATHFLRKHAKASARRITGLSDDALSYLTSYDWPGNVRELENALERAIVLGATEQILADDLPESIVESGVATSPSGTKFHETIKEFKKQLVTKALDQSDGSYGEAAKRLGLHPNNLHRLLKTLNLK
jgi:transcriptional regulator with GAF, ATPase, and Fis domain/pSer/pThr/pTyr-binding forkhead associated (FHA) protein